MAPGEGDLVTDNVRLVRVLGRGGMGTVWVGRHLALDMDVAVKLIAAEVMARDDTAAVTRFRREARLAAKLDSPHVVRTFDHGVTSAGVPYIVMELLQGESLAERVARRGRLPLAEVAVVVAQVAEGLTQAHALGIIHRDVKPQNIYLARTAGGEVAKLVDFGIARTAAVAAPTEVATSTGALVGTPHYMSPEQLMRVSQLGPAVDVWALAVVAYEAFVGRLPFAGETLAATLVAITRAEMAPPSSFVPETPTAADAFFARALAVDPDRRFESARALAAALSSAASTGAAADLAPARPEPAPPPSHAETQTAEFLADRGLDVPSSSRALTDDVAARGENPGMAPTETALVAPAAAIEGATLPSAASALRERDARASGPPATNASASSSRVARVALVAIGVLAAAVLGLRLLGPGSVAVTPGATTTAASGAPAPQTSELPVLAPPSSAAPLSSAALRLGSVPRTEIEAGAVPASRIWLPAFSFAREAGDENATFLDAQRVCERRAMSLCTEVQWTKACAARGELSAQPSWTVSLDQGGVVLRGGGSCGARATARPLDVAPDRVGVCCTRAIGISSDQKNAAFLATTSKKLLDYEVAMNAGDPVRLAEMIADPTVHFGEQKSRATVLELAAAVARSRVACIHDVCGVELGQSAGPNSWIADCTLTVTSPAEIFLQGRRYVRGGAAGAVTDTRDTRRPVGFVTRPR